MKPFFLFTFAIFTAVQAETTQNFVNQAISSNPEIRYYEAEIAAELQRPVVQQLIQLIRLRNSHPAFAGEFSSETSDVSIPP